LISRDLTYSIEQTYRDDNENILCLYINISGCVFKLISIYGPNSNDMLFFNDLRNILARDPDVPVLSGGDWNMSVSVLDSRDNIDIINMQNPPSIYRSRLLYDICCDFNLSDPFRVLHPTRRDFTYIPRANTNNRSRIDFFIISNNLLNHVKSCEINPYLSTTLFDHKPVMLNFGLPVHRKNNSININTLNHSRFDAIVACTATEVYLQHADNTRDEVHMLTAPALRQVGEINLTIRRINDLEMKRCIDTLTQNESNDLEHLTGSLPALIGGLPDPELLNNIPLTTSNDIFFEVLTQCLMNNLKSFQGWLRKLHNARLNLTSNNIALLKQDYITNQQLIFQAEQELNQLIELELNGKIAGLKIFENLNCERPTPLFLSLTKSRNSDSLEKIKDDDGRDFLSDDDRDNYIFNNFQELYRNRDDMPLPDDAIDQFLGPEIASSDLVTNSKLTDQERESLDVPLSIAELDLSVKNAKLRSAPGADGYSNILIQRCWKYLRLPLLNYSNFCFNSGQLTHNFRSARIKLIPKKGDVTKLKNWRPISLLSNLYKILSRAINNRLNKIINRVCSRAQKGYNSYRYTQEVLINTWEKISYCRKNGIKGAIVAIDMAKAFDTLSHNYVNAVYKFFNIGPNMCRWLNLIGKDRVACISLGTGKDSNYFNLGRGRPQGDNVSPNTFNFSEQILIFKLELDPGILPIPKNCPRIINQVNSHFINESNHETSKNESLADDNTTLTIFEEQSLRRIKIILQEFEQLSGLACNFDKTCVMPTFRPSEEDLQLLNTLNFRYAESITLLGVEISMELDNIPEIFNKIQNKIVSLASYWERFRLSLTGRIVVAKTFLISQLNYVACWLPVPEESLNNIQNILDNFVTGNLNISRNRIHLPANLGGLGMFNLKDFFVAQNCSWIVRANRLCIDNWRYDLISFCQDHNLGHLRASDLNQNDNPILYNLANSFDLFCAALATLNGNYKSAYIYDNAAFKYDNTKLNRNFFGNNFFTAYEANIRSLKFSDCFQDGVFKTWREFAAMQIPLNLATWMRLRAALLSARQKYSKNTESLENLCIGPIEFISTVKKGSKKIRTVINTFRYSSVNILEHRICTTYAELTNTILPAVNILGNCLATWTPSWLNSDIRSFVFKFRNNVLPLANRVHNYDVNVDPRCLFCRVRDGDTATRESFAHCFFDCDTVHDIIYSLKYEFFPHQIDPEKFKTAYWYGIYDESDNNLSQSINNTFWDVVRYTVYKFKTRRILPNQNMVRNSVIFTLNTTLWRYTRLRLLMLSNPKWTSLSRALG
jgi:Reverse transcriptase (RNA-dependent DNA polymerase)